MKTSIQKPANRKPIILIPADVKQIGEHPFHVVGQKYIMAVVDAAGGLPLLVPAISNHVEMDELLAMADGVLLTGSVSNLHPSHFGQTVHDILLPLDPARDALTLRLIRATIASGIPLLAICRGFQEMNVAFGGSLHQAVQEVAGLNDHREAKDLPIDTQYAVAHSVKLNQAGRLTKILGVEKLMVNSIHGQGVDRLGVGLTVEAYATDGLVEALSVDAQTFALGV